VRVNGSDADDASIDLPLSTADIARAEATVPTRPAPKRAVRDVMNGDAVVQNWVVAGMRGAGGAGRGWSIVDTMLCHASGGGSVSDDGVRGIDADAVLAGLGGGGAVGANVWSSTWRWQTWWSSVRTT